VVAPEHEVRPRNTLLLLLVLVALGAYIYWVELPGQKREAEAKKLVTLQKDDVTAIALDYPDHSIGLAKNEQGDWRVTKPVEADADDPVVNNMLTAIAEADVSRTLDDVGDKLGQYGLDKPEAIVTLTLKDGKPFPVLKVGKTTQVGASAYLQKGDDAKVYIGTAAFQGVMKKQVKDVRDKSLMTFEDHDVQKLELAKDGTAIAIERADPERWRITAPGTYPADPAEMRALLASIRGLRIDDFVSDDPAVDLAKYGLTAPQLRVAVTAGKDGAQKTLLLGAFKDDDKNKKSIYAKRAELPSVVSLPDYALKNVDKSLATLRDKTDAAFAKDQAAKVAVTRKDGNGFTLVKRDGAWHVEEPGEGTERGPTITHFIDDAASFKGTDIVAEGPAVNLGQYGLTTPDLSVVVTDADGKQLANLVGARGPQPASDPNAIAYVAPASGEIVYSVKPFVFDRIDKKRPDFREQPRVASPGAPGVTPGAAGAAPTIVGGEGAGGGDDLAPDEGDDGEADDGGDAGDFGDGGEE
jgi:hypothetical protein